MSAPALRFDRQACADLARARRREWLETNGIGGFASSTIAGMNTRRYHGLLVAATRPPRGRMLLLSKLDETLLVGGRACELGTNQYPGAVHPAGYLRQLEFRLDPMPVFVYEAGGIVLEKKVFMVHGANTTVVRYRILEGERAGAALVVRPLVAGRDVHALTQANDAIDRTLERGEGWIALAPYRGVPAIYLNHDRAEAVEAGDWYYNFEYEAERERGLDWREDLYSPCALRLGLERGEASLVASTGIVDARRADALERVEVARREGLDAGWEASDPLVAALVRAADAFIVGRSDARTTLLAGYPWFTDWGRDAMIALPGLALVTGRHEEARAVLSAFARHCDAGMIPNYFPDAAEPPEYNTVDATLWFVDAVFELVSATGDRGWVRAELYDTLLAIVDHHLAGTRFGIRAGGDGLLESGDQGAALTWMDARVDGRPVTPRAGKPVEVEALWYNALRIVQHLAQQFGDRRRERQMARLASRVRRSFLRQFWNPGTGCLFDCVRDREQDGSIRPNQILAASLPFSMLTRDAIRSVVERVTRELLTPFGLRSLAPSDPAYRGRYEGGPAERDSAYHQGTVWPWLLGPYVTARLRASGAAARSRREAAALLDPFREHLRDACIGSVSEIFDGDAPHAPRGAIAQAWSVAELLRVSVELTKTRARRAAGA